jgi:hypothetical protein
VLRVEGMLHSHKGRKCAGPQELPNACLRQHLRSNMHHHCVCQSKQTATTTVMPKTVKNIGSCSFVGKITAMWLCCLPVPETMEVHEPAVSATNGQYAGLQPHSNPQ